MTKIQTIIEKIYKRFIIVVLVGIVIFDLAIFINSSLPVRVNLSEYTSMGQSYSKPEDFSIFYGFEKIVAEKFYYDFSGWIIKEGEKVNTFEVKIAMYDRINDDYIIFKATMINRDDIPKYYNDIDFRYNLSGFSTRISRLLLSKDVNYEICIIYSNNSSKYIIHTGYEIVR